MKKITNFGKLIECRTGKELRPATLEEFAACVYVNGSVIVKGGIAAVLKPGSEDGRLADCVGELLSRDMPDLFAVRSFVRDFVARSAEWSRARPAPSVEGRRCCVLTLGPDAEEAMRRYQDLKSDEVFFLDTGRARLGSRIKKAARERFDFAIVVGEQEMKSKTVVLQNLSTGAKTALPLEFAEKLREILGR